MIPRHKIRRNLLLVQFHTVRRRRKFQWGFALGKIPQRSPIAQNLTRDLLLEKKLTRVLLFGEIAHRASSSRNVTSDLLLEKNSDGIFFW